MPEDTSGGTEQIKSVLNARIGAAIIEYAKKHGLTVEDVMRTALDLLQEKGLPQVEACQHTELQFNSGDFYLVCTKCSSKWALVGGQPEYGIDAKGQPIGANPLLQNRGFVPNVQGEFRKVPNP